MNFFRFPDKKPAPIDWRLGFFDDTELDGGTSTISWSDAIGDAEPGNGGASTISWSDSSVDAEPRDGGTSTIIWSISVGDAEPGCGDTSTISRSEYVDGPGFSNACAPNNPWSVVEDIVDDAGPDGPGPPGGTSQFINSYPDSVNNPGLGGAWSGLDTGDGSSGIDGSD